MCLTIPAKILELKKNNKAIADFLGRKEQVNTQLVDNIKVGEYALISSGFIIKKISAKEAEEIFKTLNSNKEAR